MRLLSSCPWHCQTDSHHCQTDSSQLISGYGSQKAKPYLPLSLSLSLSAGHNPSPGSSPNETPLSLTSSMGQADPILTISLLLSLVVIWTHSTLTYPSSELHVKHGGPHPSTAGSLLPGVLRYVLRPDQARLRARLTSARWRPRSLESSRRRRVKSVTSPCRRGAEDCPSGHTKVASLVVGSVVDAELLTGKS